MRVETQSCLIDDAELKKLIDKDGCYIMSGSVFVFV